jgi:hypothetical protein
MEIEVVEPAPDDEDIVRPFQENRPPKYNLSSEEKASDLEGFKF